MREATAPALLPVDDVSDTARKHAVGPAASKFSASRRRTILPLAAITMTEEPLMDHFPENPRLLMDRVLPEGLIRRVHVNLHVDELETGIHVLMQKGEKGSDVLRSLISSLNLEISKVRQFENALLREQQRFHRY